MLPLFLIVFVDLVGFGVIIPLLPFYGEHFQASPVMVGALMATFSAAQFVAAPIWGAMSDRRGRRPVLLISLFAAALSYVWLAFADSLWMLFAARALSGFMAGNLSAAFAYIADVTTPANRARGMGIVGAAFGLGFIFGPAIGGFLAGNDPSTADYTSPALVAAGLSLTAFVLTLFFLPESLPKERRSQRTGDAPSRWQRLRLALRTPLIGRLILLSFLSTFVFAGLESTFAMWSRRTFGWGPEQNGYIFAFVGIIIAMIQGGLIGRLAHRFSEARLIAGGSVALAIGMLAIPQSTTLPWLLAAMTITAIGFSCMTPALNSMISLNTDQTMQGGLMGVTRSATTLARVAGPAWAGVLFHFLGKSGPFYGGAVVMAGVVAIAIVLVARVAKKPAASSAMPNGKPAHAHSDETST